MVTLEEIVPLLFFGLCGLFVALFVLFVILRARSQSNRWAGWQQMAAARGLQAVTGDPLQVAPMLSGSVTSRSVQRTLSGMVDGIPIAVVLTVGLSGRGEVHARSDLFGLARVGAPVPVDRIRAALSDVPDVRISETGDFAVLQQVRGLGLAVDQPRPETAARMFDVTVRAGRAARQ